MRVGPERKMVPDMNLGLPRRTRSEAGVTLLETLIAAVILLFVLLSMISSYSLGRRNIDREEVKRKATAIAQDRIEQVKSRYAHDPLTPGWLNIIKAKVDTTYIVDGTTFTVSSTVVEEPVYKRRKTVSLDVSWTAKKNNNTPVVRKIRATTDITRIIRFSS